MAPSLVFSHFGDFKGLQRLLSIISCSTFLLCKSPCKFMNTYPTRIICPRKNTKCHQQKHDTHSWISQSDFFGVVNFWAFHIFQQMNMILIYFISHSAPNCFFFIFWADTCSRFICQIWIYFFYTLDYAKGCKTVIYSKIVCSTMLHFQQLVLMLTHITKCQWIVTSKHNNRKRGKFYDAEVFWSPALWIKIVCTF